MAVNLMSHCKVVSHQNANMRSHSGDSVCIIAIASSVITARLFGSETSSIKAISQVYSLRYTLSAPTHETPLLIDINQPLAFWTCRPTAAVTVDIFSSNDVSLHIPGQSRSVKIVNSNGQSREGTDNRRRNLQFLRGRSVAPLVSVCVGTSPPRLLPFTVSSTEPKK